MAQVTSFINLTTTGTVIPTGGGVLSSFYVNSTSSGAFKLWHGTARADIGVPMGGTITPAAGFHNMDNMNCTAGVYLEGTAGSFNITFKIKYTD